jgi:succinate-acetate transporter protein
LSVSEDRTVQPATAPAPVSSIADPAPLGLAAFALTTFLLSAKNAGWMTHATGSSWLGFAFAYGGLAQFAAGMWEFRRGNTFGATAFGTFGAFWIGIALWIELVVNPAVAAIKPVTAAATVAAINHDLGWILLGFAIITLYLLILTTQVNVAVFLVFLALFVTLVILAIGNFNAGSALLPTGTIKVGGYVGLVTALLAFYASAAGVAAGMGGRLLLPVGRPLIS